MYECLQTKDVKENDYKRISGTMSHFGHKRVEVTMSVPRFLQLVMLSK